MKPVSATCDASREVELADSGRKGGGKWKDRSRKLEREQVSDFWERRLLRGASLSGDEGVSVVVPLLEGGD